MKTTTNHNKNEDNSDPKPGSTVAMSCYRSVTRNIRGDMFRRLFFGSFLFAEKEMNKSAIDEISIMDVKNRVEILKRQQTTTKPENKTMKGQQNPTQPKKGEKLKNHNKISLPGIYPAAGGRGIGGKTTKLATNPNKIEQLRINHEKATNPNNPPLGFGI